jgi:hypothetical protein
MRDEPRDREVEARVAVGDQLGVDLAEALLQTVAFSRLRDQEVGHLMFGRAAERSGL